MNDTIKYVKLFWMLVLSVAGFILVMVLVFLGLRLMFGVVNLLPWITFIYTLFILSVPPGIFISAYTIFLRRTRSSVSGNVRIISFLVLGAFLCAWIIIYITDIIKFFTTSRIEVLEFNSWNLIFLTASVAGLFIVGIIQALGAPKEEDWMARNREHQEN